MDTLDRTPVNHFCPFQSFSQFFWHCSYLRERPVSFIHSFFFFLSGSSFQNIRQDPYCFYSWNKLKNNSDSQLLLLCLVQVPYHKKHEAFLHVPKEWGYFYKKRVFSIKKIHLTNMWSAYLLSKLCIITFKALHVWPLLVPPASLYASFLLIHCLPLSFQF